MPKTQITKDWIIKEKDFEKDKKKLAIIGIVLGLCSLISSIIVYSIDFKTINPWLIIFFIASICLLTFVAFAYYAHLNKRDFANHIQSNDFSVLQVELVSKSIQDKKHYFCVKTDTDVQFNVPVKEGNYAYGETGTKFWVISTIHNPKKPASYIIAPVDLFELALEA